MAATALPPGPRLPGIAQAVLWGLRYPQFTSKGHARFGRTFTIKPGTMPRIVLTTDRDAIKALLTGDPLTKAHANDAVRPLVGERSILLLGPEEHLARRKLLLPPFHGDRVRGYAALMEELMEAEVARWRPDTTVTTLPIAQDVTIEVILQAVLGVADLETRNKLRRLIDSVLFYPFGSSLQPKRQATAFAAGLLTPAVATYFPGLKKRGLANPPTLPWWRQRDRLFALMDEHIAAAKSDPRLEERTDILAMLVQARDEDGHALSTQDLQDDLFALIGAGHETTAAAIAWAMTLLAHNPEVRDRAADAARAGDDEYLGAVVKEVLRIRPPIPVAAGRTLSEPIAVGESEVPAGTMILIDAWGLHHDPEIYPDPERFDPERFLGEGPPPYTWLPFGGGAHRCIGSALAELEIKVALKTALSRVRVDPAGPKLAPVARRGITIVPLGGGRIRVLAP